MKRNLKQKDYPVFFTLLVIASQSAAMTKQQKTPSRLRRERGKKNLFINYFISTDA